MVERKLLGSLLNILYAVFNGTFFSSKITERLSPVLTLCMLLFFISISGSSIVFEIVTFSSDNGLLTTESAYKSKIKHIETKNTDSINFTGGFLKPIIRLLVN